MPGPDQQKEAQQKLIKEMLEGKRFNPFGQFPEYDPIGKFKSFKVEGTISGHSEPNVSEQDKREDSKCNASIGKSGKPR